MMLRLIRKLQTIDAIMEGQHTILSFTRIYIEADIPIKKTFHANTLLIMRFTAPIAFFYLLTYL